MATFREASDWLLGTDAPVKWLRLVDDYVPRYLNQPDMFELPHAHAILQPLIARFAKTPAAFPDYVKAIRDSLPKGMASLEVNAFYRTVLVRHVQQERRARLSRALVVYERRYGPLTPDQKHPLARALEGVWAQRRLEALRKRRKQSRRNRLSSEEQAEALKEFWDQTDREIDTEKLPDLLPGLRKKR